MKPVILTMLPLFRKQLVEKLNTVYRVVGPFPDPLASLKEMGIADQVRVIITTGPDGTTRELIAALPNLTLIAVYGAGYENVDLAAAKTRGIAVTTGRGGNSPSVADYAMAIMMGLSLRLFDAHRMAIDGTWDRVPPTPWAPPVGFTGRVGIFGLGEVGSRIAKRAAGFDVEIGYCSRQPKANVGYRYFPTLAAMAEWSDYLVLSCRLTDETNRIVDRTILKALGPNGYLINVARGALVDEAALIEALTKKEIAGAGLEVFWNEPDVPDALKTMPNVVLSPHIAGSTLRAYDAIDALLLENLTAHFAGEPLVTPLAAVE